MPAGRMHSLPSIQNERLVWDLIIREAARVMRFVSLRHMKFKCISISVWSFEDIFNLICVSALTQSVWLGLPPHRQAESARRGTKATTTKKHTHKMNENSFFFLQFRKKMDFNAVACWIVDAAYLRHTPRRPFSLTRNVVPICDLRWYYTSQFNLQIVEVQQIVWASSDVTASCFCSFHERKRARAWHTRALLHTRK